MTAVIEGDHGVGMVGCMKSMRLAIGKAREGGIGIVLTVRNNHFLAATPYCLEAAKAGMVGIAFSNTKPAMGYPGARGRAIGNSPLGFGIPTAAGFPILFDASLTISGGRLRQWIREGRRIPAGLQGVDGDGRPSDDPQAVLVGGTPLPIGGHKGAGLAILVEVLTGVLGGAAFLGGITPPGEDLRDKSRALSHCCIAIDVEAFMPRAEFESRMAEFVADLKDHPVEEGPGRSACRASAWSGRDSSARPAASRWSRTCARPWRSGRSGWAWTSPMDEDYRLRGAVAGDLDRIGEIIREAWEPIFALHEQSWGEELFEFLYANGAERIQANVGRHLAQHPEWIFVVEKGEGGEVVAFIQYLLDEERGLGTVGLNAVASAYQGRGIGTMMYDFVLHRFREAGLRYARVRTGLNEAQAGARRAYEKAGFDMERKEVIYYARL